VLIAEAVTKKTGSGDEIVFAAFGLAALAVAFLIWAR
jgi:LPXTG-motif cell wall-anchored protein